MPHSYFLFIDWEWSKKAKKGHIFSLHLYGNIDIQLLRLNGKKCDFLDFDFFATKIVSLVLILNEVKSMDESWVVLKGYSFIDKFKESITQIKDIKKQLKWET